jgi:dCMP deaminase
MNDIIEFKDYIPPSWDVFFLQMVFLVASKSKDPSSKIGAVIVNDDNQIVKIGYNGFPSKLNDNIKDRYERPAKYRWTEHAESNAINYAAKNGVSTNNCILYTNGLSCIECTKSIIQSGIKKLVYHKKFMDMWNTFFRKEWNNHNEISTIMFKEAKIEIKTIDAFLGSFAYIDGKKMVI